MPASIARSISRSLPWLIAPFFVLEILRGSGPTLDWDGIAGMMILGYFSLLALIFIHELGHFVAARLVGIRIKKFIVGAGYRLQFKMGGTLWSFRLIPSHGYVVSELSPKSFSLFRQGLYASGGLLAQGALMFDATSVRIVRLMLRDASCEATRSFSGRMMALACWSSNSLPGRSTA